MGLRLKAHWTKSHLLGRWSPVFGPKFGLWTCWQGPFMNWFISSLDQCPPARCRSFCWTTSALTVAGSCFTVFVFSFFFDLRRRIQGGYGRWYVRRRFTSVRSRWPETPCDLLLRAHNRRLLLRPRPSDETSPYPHGS